MKPIRIESENLVIRDTGSDIATAVRGTPSAVLFLWQVLTNAMLELKGKELIMWEFMNMKPKVRKQTIQLLYKAYRLGNDEYEIARIFNELIGDDA